MTRRLAKSLVLLALAPILAACLDAPTHHKSTISTAVDMAARATVTHVKEDTKLENLFANYGNSGQGWSGGDGGASAQLPDGRIFWAFSDSFIGPVSNGVRPLNLPLLANVAVIQKGDHLSTLYGGKSVFARPFLTAGLPDSSQWYWNNGAIVSNNTLYVCYSAYSSPDIATLTYVLHATVLAAYALPSLTLESVTPISQGPQMKWGVSMLRDGKYIYIYGASFSGPSYVPTTSMYVARAPENNLLAPWQYFNGSTWSSNASDAAPLSNLVRDPYSVAKVDGVYVLFTMRDGSPLTTELQAYFGPTPAGPFSHGENIYSTALPEKEHYVNLNSIYEYGAYFHPEFTKGNTVVVSYQVNSWTAEGWMLAPLIRPRYIFVTIGVGKQRATEDRAG